MHLSKDDYNFVKNDSQKTSLIVKPTIVTRYKSLNNAIALSNPYDAIYVNDCAATEKWTRHKYVKNMTLSTRAVHFVHSSSKMNVHFVWKIPLKRKKVKCLTKATKYVTN